MIFFDKFIKSLFQDYSIVDNSEKENDSLYECELSSTIFEKKPLNEIEDSYNFLYPSDDFFLSVSFGSSDSITFNSTKGKITDFVNELSDENEYHLDDKISIKITITKHLNNNCCAIYNLSTFISTLKNLNANQFLSVFTRIFSEKEYVIFRVYDLVNTFNTESIYFSDFSSTPLLKTSFDRKRHLEDFNSTCNFSSNNSNQKLCPYDFKIINCSSDNRLSQLFNLFEYYTTLLSVIYLFDITEINENQLIYKINGYKTIKGEVDLKKLEIKKTKQYFDIYKWVYTGGNLNDKIGLARNIITLHFSDQNELDLSGSPFESIQSSYKVYEKENIKQYIEIRNKISEQLLDFNNKANSIVESFAGGFQKSAFALISFYLSAIVIGILQNNKFVNIFSLDVTILSISFIVISLIYFFISKWEINAQKNRFTNSYTNLKERYTDLLDRDDINKMLNNDKDFNDNISFIDQKKFAYSTMWITFLVILLFMSVFLFCSYNFSQISDTLLFKLIFRKTC